MATTPGKPRISGIQPPARSAIPTPGRFRSSSSAASSHPPPLPTESDTIERAFADAIKANDPSRHSSAPNLSPQSSTIRRPPSAASHPRAKTPTASLNKSTYRRPESRQSDVFSRTLRPFQVGDNVRIESLGFEGILKFIGEIDGKQGQWAGVEVSGGFAGKGKNDGSVDGKRYFVCPPKCGVFVAMAKLSAPTVGPGAIQRPSSVASSRASLSGPMSGRITPSHSGRVTPSMFGGRVTPSMSNGRVTPSLSNGRITPSSSFGFTTPSAAPRAVSRTTPRHPPPPAVHTPSAAAMSKITAGSRASKYVGMTARQLSSRDAHPGPSAPASPSRQSIGLDSPTRSSGMASPMRSGGFGSPTAIGATPKPVPRMSGLGTPKSLASGRQSLATPRARIPSAIAMPPPPSPPSSGTSRSVSLNDKPITPTFSSTSNDTVVDDDAPDSLTSIQHNSRALRDKIQQIVSGKMTPSSGFTSPSSAIPDCGDDAIPSITDAQQVKLDALIEENARLKVQLDAARAAATTASQAEAAQMERDQAQTRILELESRAKVAERLVKERESHIEALERAASTAAESAERVRAENDARTKDLQAKIDDTEHLISSLKEVVEAKATEAGQNEGVIQAKNTEIVLLEARAKKAQAELEETRQELGAQVDELRQAGQETIALYEERLSAAETKRYELEDLVETLEEQVRTRARPPSPGTVARHASEAAQIDNETLREQAMYLQKKITALEDMLEDTRATSEKDETAIRARLARYKDNEIAMKKEVADARKEVERVVKSEDGVRSRAEEIEEALRENTLALENARAEIEVLRAELAARSMNFEALQAESASGGTGKDVDGPPPPAAFDRSRDEEVAHLKEQLEVLRQAKHDVLTQLEASRSEASETLLALRQTVERLDTEKAELEEAYHQEQRKVEHERAMASELRRSLDEKATEMDAARKSFNRDRPLHNGLQDPAASPSKHDLASAREEIKGLKHIVQTLQKDLAAAATQNKLLESENKMLLSETDQLREELKSLEDNLEQSLLREERAVDLSDDSSSSPSGDLPTLPRLLHEAKAKHELEIEQLRKKMTDAEIKSARTIHELNKEVTELESLIEAKIYREDDLEREIERLTEKVSRGKKSSKSSMDGVFNDPRLKMSAASSSTALAVPPDTASSTREVCEICEQPGHDIFACPVLKDDRPQTAGVKNSPLPQDPSELFCEDCESHGHLATECPHSLDVF